LDDDQDPQWIRVLVLAIAAAVAAFGGVALTLAASIVALPPLPVGWNEAVRTVATTVFPAGASTVRMTLLA